MAPPIISADSPVTEPPAPQARHADGASRPADRDSDGNRAGTGGTWAATSVLQPVPAATYDVANRQVSFGGQTLTYDLNGNLTSDGTNTYTWDARNHLVAIAGVSVTASFGYDAQGRRQGKTVNGTATQFLYDGLNPVQELTGATVGANLLTGLGIDEYLTRTDATGARHFLTDALGSTVGLTDATGSVPTRYTYEPFGATTISGAATGNAFDYTGRENDAPGLYYHRARYYHAGRQRFVAEDPLPPHFRSVSELNAYAYVANNPMLFRDPLAQQTLAGPNYCGPGGSGPILSATDRCCKGHDDCYGRAGVDATYNMPWPFGKTPTPEQIRCMGNCDDVLCWCLSRVKPAGSTERDARSRVQSYFCSRFSGGAP